MNVKYIMFPLKKITKFKTLSNNKYKLFNLENIIYCINNTLLENNQIILKRFGINTYKF